MRRARLLATHHRGVYAALRRACLARDAVCSLMFIATYLHPHSPTTKTQLYHRVSASTIPQHIASFQSPYFPANHSFRT